MTHRVRPQTHAQGRKKWSSAAAASIKFLIPKGQNPLRLPFASFRLIFGFQKTSPFKSARPISLDITTDTHRIRPSGEHRQKVFFALAWKNSWVRMGGRGTKSNEEHHQPNLFSFNDIRESLDMLGLKGSGAIVCLPDRQMRFKGES